MSIALQKGLVLHQTLDLESLKSSLIFGDKTPYGNDGLCANAPVFTADWMGQPNRAMVFDHTNNDAVVIPDDESLRPGTDDFALSFWIKGPLSGSLAWDGIITKGLNTSFLAHTWGVVRTGTTTSLMRYQQSTDAGGTHDVNISLNIASNEWINIIINRVGSTVTIYVNDIQKGQDASAGSDLSSDYEMRIGVDSQTRYCSCTLADFRQYNRSLSAEERTALYEMYRPKLMLVV